MEIAEKPTIAIIGGGLAGLTLSIGLTSHGIPHRIYESAVAFSEIGAGVALGPNSIAALELLDPRMKNALAKCITYNEGIDSSGEGQGREEWCEVRVGEEQGFHTLITKICHTGSQPGRACFHRAKFLEELIKLIPSSIVSFGKSLTSISEDPPSGNLFINFADGSTATASAIVACDGIKSVARRAYVLSEPSDQESWHPVFAHDFAYRGMFPRAQFLEITLDSIDAGKGTMYCGPDSYVIMYPVEKGSLMNVVAVKRISSVDADSEFAALQHAINWIQPVALETMLSDFESWGTPIKALLSHIKRPERWALYDHLPARTYVKGRVALMGDAAHATTPHQGQGAGMAFEDSLILSGILGEILAQPGTTNPESRSTDAEIVNINAKVEACLRAYDKVRRPRTQKITQTSREMGKIICCAEEGIGNDFEKLKENLNARMSWIWDIDLLGEISRGVNIAKELQI